MKRQANSEGYQDQVESLGGIMRICKLRIIISFPSLQKYRVLPLLHLDESSLGAVGVIFAPLAEITHGCSPIQPRLLLLGKLLRWLWRSLGLPLQQQSNPSFSMKNRETHTMGVRATSPSWHTFQNMEDGSRFNVLKCSKPTRSYGAVLSGFH